MAVEEVVKNLLRPQRERLVSAWLAKVATCDPDPSARLLTGNRDRFRNPVRFAYEQALPSLFDELVGDMDRSRITSALDPVMHLRALQAQSPSDAASFILILNGVLHDALGGGPDEGRVLEALSAAKQRIDEIAVVARAIFTACRRKIEDIRAREAARRTRAGTLAPRPGPGPRAPGVPPRSSR